jgi:hypothetical protein
MWEKYSLFTVSFRYGLTSRQFSRLLKFLFLLSLHVILKQYDWQNIRRGDRNLFLFPVCILSFITTRFPLDYPSVVLCLSQLGFVLEKRNSGGNLITSLWWVSQGKYIKNVGYTSTYISMFIHPVSSICFEYFTFAIYYLHYSHWRNFSKLNTHKLYF